MSSQQFCPLCHGLIEQGRTTFTVSNLCLFMWLLSNISTTTSFICALIPAQRVLLIIIWRNLRTVARYNALPAGTVDQPHNRMAEWRGFRPGISA